jgi:hypothetical protein
MVSIYSETPSNSAFPSILFNKFSPENGLGISASIGRKSLSLPPKA